jgi:phosphoribosylformylglycinamidine synthase
VEQADALRAEGLKAGVAVARVGRFGGTDIRFGESRATLADLSALYRSAFAGSLGL